MPKVTITTALVTVELEAGGADIDDLRKQALATLTEAVQAMPKRNELGFGIQDIERHGAPTHVDIGMGGWPGFAPAHAQERGNG